MNIAIHFCHSFVIPFIALFDRDHLNHSRIAGKAKDSMRSVKHLSHTLLVPLLETETCEGSEARTEFTETAHNDPPHKRFLLLSMGELLNIRTEFLHFTPILAQHSCLLPRTAPNDQQRVYAGR